MTIIMCDSRQTHFWHKVWCANDNLCSSFPDIYNVARERNVLVGQLWKEGVTGGVGSPIQSSST